MITDTKDGQTNYCPNCEDQARRIEELEAEIKQLAAWSEDCTTKLERRQAHLRAELFALASTVSEYLLFTAKSTDLSRAYHSAIEVINATPAQSEAQKWNQLRRCHKYFGGENVVAIPELKEVKE